MTGFARLKLGFATGLSFAMVALFITGAAAQNSETFSVAAESERLAQIGADPQQQANLIDEQLGVISRAIEAGEYAFARELLIEVTQFFETIFAAKGFDTADRRAQRAVIGMGEAEKYYIGDPHEQMFAFLYLGLLDLYYGDLDYARASFRAASLADQQSSIAGNDVDCYMAFLFEGLANLWLGRGLEANESFDQARRAFRFRAVAEIVADAYRDGFDDLVATGVLTPEKPKRKLKKRYDARRDNLFLVAYEQANLSVLLDRTARDAIQSSFEIARQATQHAQKNSKTAHWDYVNSFEGKLDQKKVAAADLLTRYEDHVLASISQDGLNSILQREQQFENLIARLTDPAVNVIAIHGFGNGPLKEMGGEFGEHLTFQLQPHGSTGRDVRILFANGQPAGMAQPIFLESVDYQATTRGGRAIDEVLARRAVRTKKTTTAGKVLKGLGVLAAVYGAASDNDDIFKAGLATFAVGATIQAVAPIVANTKVDTRNWAELPKEFYISAHSLQPGDYAVELAGAPSGARPSTVFRVPASGKAIVLFGDRAKSRVQPTDMPEPIMAPDEGWTRVASVALDEVAGLPLEPINAALQQTEPALYDDPAVGPPHVAARPSPIDAESTSTAQDSPIVVAQAPPAAAPTTDVAPDVEPPIVITGLDALSASDMFQTVPDYGYIEISYPDAWPSGFPVKVTIDGVDVDILIKGETYLARVSDGEHTITLSDPIQRAKGQATWRPFNVRIEVRPLDMVEIDLLPEFGPRGSTALVVETKRFDSHVSTQRIQIL